MTAPPSKTCLDVSFISHWVYIKWLRKPTSSNLHIIPSLNKDIGFAVILSLKSFFMSSSLAAIAVSLVQSAVGFRLIYFPSFITPVLYRLSIGWTFDLDLIFAACRKIPSNSFWMVYLIRSVLWQLIKLSLSGTVILEEIDLNLSSAASKGIYVDNQS